VSAAAHGGAAPPPMPPPDAPATTPAVMEAPPPEPVRGSVDGLEDLRRFWRLGQWLAVSEGDMSQEGNYRGAMRLQYASELGLPPALTARLIHVQRDGRVTLGAELLRALAARDGYRIQRADSSDEACTAVVIDAEGVELGRSTYTLQQAERAGLLSKQNWQRHPEDMLWARASARAVKDWLPGVGLGLEPAEGYVPADLDFHGEADDPMTADGDYVADAEDETIPF